MLENKISEIINNKIIVGRLISLSKTNYMKKHKFETVVFNANIFVFIDNIPTKVWYGDLNINLDGKILKKLSNKINKELFILSEFDGRFIDEDKIDLSKKIWSTNDKVPFLSKKDIKLKKKEAKIKIKKNKKLEKERLKKMKKENKTFPIITPTEYNNRKIVSKIKISFKLLEETLYSLLERESYLTHDILHQLIQLSRNEKITDLNSSKYDIRDYWITEETNKVLREFDLIHERKFNLDFKKKDFKREVTSNLCLIEPYFANKQKINVDSFDAMTIYVLE